MDEQRAPAYWPTRILLVVGFIAAVIEVALALTLMLTVAAPPTFPSEPAVLGLPIRVVGSLPGVAAAVVGLVWMIRIFRGPHDEPPRWRYRDH
jgi:hypothetical protein